MHRVRLVIVTCLVGLVLGPGLDQIHVQTGTLDYAHPWWLDQAWWVGPQFALAFGALAAVGFVVQRQFGKVPAVPPATRRFVQQFAWFVLAYAVTGVLHERPWVVVAVLLAGLGLRIWSVRPDLGALRTMFLLALAGAIYEATVSYLPGTFGYTTTGWRFDIPPWLPLLYAHGAPLLRSMVLTGEHVSREDQVEDELEDQREQAARASR